MGCSKDTKITLSRVCTPNWDLDWNMMITSWIVGYFIFGHTQRRKIRKEVAKLMWHALEARRFW